MVVKTACKGYLRNGFIRVGEKLGDSAQARLEYKLIGCETENPLDYSCEAGGGQSGLGSENAWREMVIIVGLETFHRLRKIRRDGFTATWR